VTGIVTIAVSAAWGAPGIAATVLVLLLNLAYSLKPIQISHRGAWAPLLLPIAYVLYPVTLGLLLVDARITAHVILLVGLLYLHFFSRILLKDFRDVVGDKKFGKRTLALSIGTKRTTQIALGSLLTSTAGLAMLTRDVSPVSILPLVFLGGIGASLLLRLAETTKWTEQKPLILGFGRTASGVLLVICLAYGFGISPATTAKQTLAYAITAYLVTTSAYDLMRHNA
jgi:4-hydroxybenzoate polyprenyltransferase